MQKIKISNHPDFSEIERFFEVANIETDITTYAKIKGIVKYKKITIQNGTIKQVEELRNDWENGEKTTDFNTYLLEKAGITIEQKTPKGFNINGDYYELLADFSTKVNSETGAYDIEGDMTEMEYIQKYKISEIAKNLGKKIEEVNVLDVFYSLIQGSVLKQDAYKRFDK